MRTLSEPAANILPVPAAKVAAPSAAEPYTLTAHKFTYSTVMDALKAFD